MRASVFYSFNTVTYFSIITHKLRYPRLKTYCYVLCTCRYMGAFALFCTNAINIYAGINGLEAGQSFISACVVLWMNLYEVVIGTYDTAKRHFFSAMLIIPFVASTAGILRYNWYPSRVFVGDTFTYFAGMTFSVVGILGHFTKSLWLLLIPQLLNFIISVPQLLKIVPCPRHRLPLLDKKTGLLIASRINSREPADKPLVPPEKNIINLTLLNVTLLFFGPMSESTLCITMMVFQLLCCTLALLLRYTLVDILYEYS